MNKTKLFCLLLGISSIANAGVIKIRSAGQPDAYVPTMDSDNSSNLTVRGLKATTSTLTTVNATTVNATNISGAVSGNGSGITSLNAGNISSGTLAVVRGGTNSSTALSNNRVMQSSGSAIVESAAITANRALISDSNGIPTHSTVTNTQLGYLSGTNGTTGTNALVLGTTPTITTPVFTGNPTGTITSGSWTPTFGYTGNVTAMTIREARYQRVGNMVILWLKINYRKAINTAAENITFTLPAPPTNNFTAYDQFWRFNGPYEYKSTIPFDWLSVNAGATVGAKTAFLGASATNDAHPGDGKQYYSHYTYGIYFVE